MSPQREAAPPGLAAERTALAWHRSAIGVAAIGGLLVKTAVQTGETALGAIAGVVLGALAICVWAFGSIAYARRRAESWGREEQRRALRLITAVSIVSAALAAAIAVVASL